MRAVRRALAVTARTSVALVLLASAYCAVVVGLLAVGVAAGRVDTVTGYRWVVDRLEDVPPARWDEWRLWIGIGGAAVLVGAALLALASVPWPRRRGPVPVVRDRTGSTVVSTSVVSGIAEHGARSEPAVRWAHARLVEHGVELSLGLDAREPASVVAPRSREAASAALARHGLSLDVVGAIVVGVTAGQRQGDIPRDQPIPTKETS